MLTLLLAAEKMVLGIRFSVISECRKPNTDLYKIQDGSCFLSPSYMNKLVLYILLVVGLTVVLQKGSAQLIYFSDSFGQLFTVDISSGGCEVDLIGSMQFNGSSFIATDIAFHPNGKLYATDGLGLYDVNISTQVATFIGNLYPLGDGNINALVCNSDGVLYGADFRLYTINISNGNATSQGALPCSSAGDLAFNNNDLYLACEGNELLKIDLSNPGSSQVVGTMTAFNLFFGIVTFATECADIQTFGTAGNGLYEIDVNNANSVLACNLTGVVEVYGAAMESEFIASDCELVLDLDGDDSSGAEGLDFFADTICGNFESMVADFDFAITTTFQSLDIDSIVFTITTGQLDGAAEQLLLDQTGTEYDVFGSGTNHLTAVNTTGDISAGAAHALENIRYIDLANPFTPGVREVAVQIFAQDDIKSDIAIAFITLMAREAFIIDIGPDSVLCEGETLLLDASFEDAISYVWNDGSTNPSLDVSSSGLYTVTVTNDCGSTSTDDMMVSFVPPVDLLDLGSDTVLCPGESLSLDATLIDGMAYEWSDGSENPQLTVAETGIYTVSVTAGCGIQTDDIYVEFQEIPVFSIFPEDTLACQGETIIFDATLPDALAYKWQDGSTQAILAVSEAGYYQVTVSLQCGEYTAEVLVRYNDYEFDIDLGPDTTFCFENEVILNASSPYAITYLWQDGTTAEDFIVNRTGNYSVTLTDGCTEVKDQLFLRMTNCCDIFVPNVFSPNFDGANDRFQTFSNCEFPVFNLKVFNRWGGLVYQTNDQFSGWDGQYKGKDGQQGVYVWILQYNDGLEDQVLSGDVTLVR
ncbi:MAG: gliding motility-associated-like protein [Saprospiraceae bacterium]